jgi:NAD+ synthase (glutamine-hydrolysing)
MILGDYGFVRAAAAVPRVSVGNATRNAEEIVKLIEEASIKHGVKIIVFPELSLTGYTCADLFNQKTLLNSAQSALAHILDKTKALDILAAVGLPVEADNQLFNCAAVIYKGEILGVVPKTYLPNYNEFYEKRWFASSTGRLSDTLRLLGKDVPFGESLVFENTESELCVAVEICEDLWMPIPQSSRHALSGANLILNLSASNETVTKSDYRRELIKQQSGRCYAGYVFASAGSGESTTDVVFNGHSLIAVNDSIVAEMSYSQESALIYSDIDIEKLMNDRRKFNSFMGMCECSGYRKIKFGMKDERDVTLSFAVNPHPFIPDEKCAKDLRCREIFKLQATGLAERMRKTGIKKALLAISGGLDSTLALLVTTEAIKALGLPTENIIAVTMPGMGTTGRTYQNAMTLMREVGATVMEIPIRAAILQHFKDIGHDINNCDVTYENAQARERFQILFDLANQLNGLVVGTGDLSELALGWCTYNGDHMSNYGVNSGVPKSLVKHLVSWYMETTDNKKLASVLSDVLDTPISPELLPADAEGNIAQKTEDLVGPYELHDFFLYNVLRNGFSPAKILKLALLAFEGNSDYEPRVIYKWLETFYKRFFSQQFKRSCLPDGVKVGSVCLSPRGDWRMPSDASGELYLSELRAAGERLGLL